jgi:hypothetical protein
LIRLISGWLLIGIDQSYAPDRLMRGARSGERRNPLAATARRIDLLEVLFSRASMMFMTIEMISRLYVAQSAPWPNSAKAAKLFLVASRRPTVPRLAEEI